MTVGQAGAPGDAGAAKGQASRALGLSRQFLMVILINIPTVSLGLAMGWVSLASGESGEGEDGVGGARLVAAAATTFAAALLGVPLSARALARGRKFATIATSLTFAICWALKLAGTAGGAGGWWVVAARVAAGLGGAGAYTVPPLLAREMCERVVAGAAVAALVLAHNCGILLMYVAADQRLPHRAVLWGCLALSLIHCVVFLFVPESPAYLAAHGKHEEARASLAWLRGATRRDPALADELRALPPPDDASVLTTLKELVKDPSRRRALLIATIAVVGQESCGIFTLIQFAERTFVIARDEHAARAELAEHAEQDGALVTPARYALWLGVVQLVASAAALYLVERVGTRPLIVWTAGACGGCLAGAALAAGRALPAPAAALLGAAVAADCLGLQPAPYALLADLFHYQSKTFAGRIFAMGLLDKLSVWLGRGRAEVTVLVLGLDNSGKSTLLGSLAAPAGPHAVPTVDARRETFQSGGVSFSAWDVSGAPRHRALWERHYRRAHALVFVVDSADHLRLVVAREELQLALAHPELAGRRLPLLVFANKSDAPRALAPMQIAAALCLERITDKPWHICASNAVSGAGLADGVAWLARQIRDMHLHH